MKKRKQNDLEMLFNEMSNKASTILFRGIMMFPFAAILGFVLTVKLILPLAHDLFGITLVSDITVFATGVITASVVYFMLVEFIYDESLEREQQRIAKKILRDLEKQGEIPGEYAKKKYARELRKMAEGRRIKD